MQEDFQPVKGAQAWTAQQLANRSREWVFRLPGDALQQVYDIVRGASARGLDQDSFDLEQVEIPSLREAMQAIASEQREGSGVSLIRGIDVENLDVEELKLVLLVLGNHLGLVGPQGARRKGIGEVMDINPPKNTAYYYHVGGPLPMHMDPIDVVGLLCVREAKRGGESRIVSAMAVHNHILETRPDVLKLLYRGFRNRRREHRRDGGPALTEHYCPVFANIGGEIICNYLPAPIRMAVADGLMQLTDEEEEAIGILESTAEREDLCVEMNIAPGDIQLLNNRTILHGRADYEDHTEMERRRLLLRIWLTMRGWTKYPGHIPRFDVELQTEAA